MYRKRINFFGKSPLTFPLFVPMTDAILILNMIDSIGKIDAFVGGIFKCKK